MDAAGRLPWAFRFENEIRRDPVTGEYKAFAASEDWLWSHHLAAVGAGLAVPEEGDPFADIEDAVVVEDTDDDDDAADG